MITKRAKMARKDNGISDNNIAWFILGLAVGAIGATLIAILLIYIDSVVDLGI